MFKVPLRAVLVTILLAVMAAPAGAHMSARRVAHLKARVAAAMPTATAEVNAAAAAGPAALTALVQRVDAMPLAAPDTTTPDQYALTQALAPYVASGTNTDPASAAASLSISHKPLLAQTAASCWFVGGHIWNLGYYTEAGIRVGTFEKDHNYWCGNGYSITSNGLAGYYHKGPSSTPPWCQAVTNTANGWDAPHASWAHGIMTTHFGSYTPWTSCVTFTGRSVVVRINAVGHHDDFDDF